MLTVEGLLKVNRLVQIDRVSLKGACHQKAHTVADEAGDGLHWQRGLSVVGTHEIDGGSQVMARVNQRAIEVKNQELGFHELTARGRL